MPKPFDLLAPCPYCNKENDRMIAASDTDDLPNKGDVSICANCFNIGIFEDSLHLRKMTPEEEELAFDNPDVVKGLALLVMASITSFFGEPEPGRDTNGNY